jgi:hypothetical protein
MPQQTKLDAAFGCPQIGQSGGQYFVEDQMDEDVFEVTPVAALSATTALFLELAALLHKRGLISAPELGRNLLAAAAEAGADLNVRCVVSTLRDVGQSLIDGFPDAP